MGFPPSLMKRPIFLFNIAKGVSDRRTKYPNDCPDLYREATCQFWNVTNKYRALDGALAVGCINGITRTAVEIKGWSQVSETRWEIVPHGPTESAQILNFLTFKNVSTIIDHCKGFWQRGNFLVFRIDEKGNVAVLRGSPNRTISPLSSAS